MLGLGLGVPAVAARRRGVGGGGEPEPVVGWNLTTTTYDSVSFVTTAQETSPFGFAIKPDGTKLYVIGFGRRVYQYTLTTPWDISTATYDSLSLSVSGQTGGAENIRFSEDGTKMFLASSNLDRIIEYNLGTAWDVSTGVFNSVILDTSGQEATTSGLAFSVDGTKAFVVGLSSDRVHQYTLSTPWALSSAASDGVSLLVSGQENQPQDLFFKPDGSKLFVIGLNADRVFQYGLSTPWDITTAAYDSISHLVSAQATVPTGLFFKPDGTKMYVLNQATDTIFQYSLTS